MNGILSPAHCIYTVSNDLVIMAYRDASNLEIAVSFGHLIHVKHDLLISLKVSLFPAINGVLLSFFIAGIIIVPIALIGHRHISLFDPADNFIIQFRLKLRGMLQHSRCIGILCLKIGDHLLVLPFIKPVIWVNACVVMSCEHFIDLLCNRWFHGIIIINTTTKD